MARNKFCSICYVLGLVILFAGCDQVCSTTSRGIKAFQKENYEEAAANFEKAVAKDSESDLLNYNLGTALCKNGEFDKAKDHLQKALLSENPDLRKSAHYNLGNTHYKSGMEKKDTEIGEAIGDLEQAKQHFESTLAIDPEDEDAKANLEVVKEKIEELKKLQQQQKEKQGKQGGQGKQEQQNSEQQGAGSQNASQQGQKNNGQQQGQNGTSKGDKQDKGQNGEQGDNGSDKKTGEEENLDKDQAGKISALNGNQEETGYNDGDMSGAGDEDPDKKEAQRLLQGYQEKEEPKGVPGFMRGSSRTRPVEKDW